MKIQIILEVDADELDWQRSTVVPCDSGMVDVDIDAVLYQGRPIEFADDDAAADYLLEMYEHKDEKCYRYA